MGMTKSRYWWVVMYPENMREGWQDDIGDLLQLPYAYCIHDRDVDSKTEQRKLHVHIMIVFPNTTTYNHAFQVLEVLNAPGRSAFNKIECCISVRGSYDYLIHDTDTCRKKGKLLYQPEERITGNCFDIGSYEQISLSEKKEATRKLAYLIRSRGIENFADFYDAACLEYPDDDVIEDVIFTRSGFLERLIKGVYHKHHG